MKIQVQIDDRSGDVDRATYVADTLRRLQDFGYPDLTGQEVDDAVEAALAGKDSSDVIFIFVAKEVRQPNRT